MLCTHCHVHCHVHCLVHITRTYCPYTSPIHIARTHGCVPTRYIGLPPVASLPCTAPLSRYMARGIHTLESPIYASRAVRSFRRAERLFCFSSHNLTFSIYVELFSASRSPNRAKFKWWNRFRNVAYAVHLVHVSPPSRPP